MAIGLARLFNFFDDGFKCSLTHNGDEAIEVDNELKYKSIESEFYWKFPDDSKFPDLEYSHKDQISGMIITTGKPLKPGLRGITLYAKGRLANQAEFFDVSESSHGFSYITGWLNVDFVDDMKEDVISTNRQSLNWELPGIIELRRYLASLLRLIERDWRKNRKEERQKVIQTKTQVDLSRWYGALPSNIQPAVEFIVNAVVEESELPNAESAKVVRNIHELVPEYPHYHWRHLHRDVQDSSKAGYEAGDYYKALIEAIKRYTSNVQKKSGVYDKPDSALMGAVLGSNGTLKVAGNYVKPNGDEFNQSTIDNIEEGQQHLSMGIVRGARNPVSHEEISALKESGLFSEKDCLDALSLLSHLFRRLDDA